MNYKTMRGSDNRVVYSDHGETEIRDYGKTYYILLTKEGYNSINQFFSLRIVWA